MHFTYIPPTGEDLCQGDVLRRTEALDEVLRSVHPHYLSNEYKLFMILTQTCDLVRRSGDCATRYIEIATVRPIDVVLQRQLHRHQDEIDLRAEVCSERSRGILLNFIKSLLNNNATEYFYLREEAELGFATGLCAFLRESIPLSSVDSYQMLLDARIVSLDPTFQAKLGWIVGHIYSRVATDDWVPKTVTEEEFEGMAQKLTNGCCMWVEDRKLKMAKKSLPANATDDQIKKIISGAKAVAKKTEILTRVCEVIRDKYPDQYDELKNLQNTLSSDNELKGMF